MSGKQSKRFRRECAIARRMLVSKGHNPEEFAFEKIRDGETGFKVKVTRLLGRTRSGTPVVIQRTYHGSR